MGIFSEKNDEFFVHFERFQVDNGRVGVSFFIEFDQEVIKVVD